MSNVNETTMPDGRWAKGDPGHLHLARGDYMKVGDKWRRLTDFGEHSLSGWLRYYFDDGSMVVKHGPVEAVLTEEGDKWR